MSRMTYATGRCRQRMISECCPHQISPFEITGTFSRSAEKRMIKYDPNTANIVHTGNFPFAACDGPCESLCVHLRGDLIKAEITSFFDR